MNPKDKELQEKIEEMLDVYEIYTIEDEGISIRFEKDIKNLIQESRNEVLDDVEKMINESKIFEFKDCNSVKCWSIDIRKLKQQLQDMREK